VRRQVQQRDVAVVAARQHEPFAQVLLCRVIQAHGAGAHLIGQERAGEGLGHGADLEERVPGRSLFGTVEADLAVAIDILAVAGHDADDQAGIGPGLQERLDHAVNDRFRIGCPGRNPKG
jgi:hypothetical protein